MEKSKENLKKIVSGERIQNSNIAIGRDLQYILTTLQNDPSSVDDDLEELIFSALSVNNSRFTSVIANALGSCLVLFYKTHKISHWKFVSIINDGILRLSIPSIVVLGVVTRHSTEGLKSQLPSITTSILQIQNKYMQPYICQCFRRILKGTGTFLTKSIQEIYNYVTKNISSSNDSLKLECYKTISALFIFSKMPMDKIIPLLNQSIVTSTLTHRYAAAKSLAAIAYSKSEEKMATIKPGENPFEYFFNLIFELVPRDPSILTISSSFVIFLKFFSPIFIMENLQFLVNFVIDFTALKYVSLPSLSILSNSIFSAVVHCTGESISNLICSSVFNLLKNKPPTGSSATVALSTFIHFTFSSRVGINFTKFAYPLLTTTRNDVRRLSTAYFAVLAQKEPKLSLTYYKTFVDFFSNLSRANENEVDGFSRVVVYNVIHHNKISIDEIRDLSLKMLKDNAFIPYAFLMLAAVQKKSPMSNEVLCQILPFVSKCFKIPKGMKFASIFLLQIVSTTKTATKDSWNEKFDEYFIPFLQNFIQNPTIYSTPTQIAFLKIARECQFSWKKINNFASSIAKLCITLANKFMTQEIADTIHPFSGQIDQVFELYGIKIQSYSATMIDSESQTVYYHLVDDAFYSNRTCLMKEIDTSFSTWVLIADNNNKHSIINSLFAPTKENNFAKILLIRSLLSRTKLSPFLPSNGLPFLLGFESVNDRVIQRYAASCVAKWLKLHPELNDACIDYLEKPTRNANFVCSIFAELSRNISDASRLVLILHKIAKTQLLTAPLFAISSLLKNNKLDDNFFAMTVSLLEKCAFNDSLRNPSSMYFYKLCFIHLKAAHPSVIFSLMNFPVFRSFALLQGYEMMKVSDQNSGLLLKPVFSSDHLPSMIFAQMFKHSDSIDDVPSMFTLLQQTHLTIVGESLLKSVDTNPNMKYWTDMCKRIVINKCVPPAERKGDIRIVPTRVVLIVAMRIVVKLVNKMRELFPLELNCIDDVVSIAFNAIQINDKKVDFHSFAILATVLRAFIDVRNRDGALLNTYLSQFHPMLRHALDGTRSLKNVADFCIQYLNFLKETENPILDESIKIVEKRLKRTDTSTGTEILIVYCRIASRLSAIAPQRPIDEKLKELSNQLIDLICQNKVQLQELSDELPEFISVNLLLMTDNTKKLVFLLLVYTLSKSDGNNEVSVFDALTILIDSISVSKEELDFIIRTAAHKNKIFNTNINSSKPANKQLFDDGDSLDAEFYWISKKTKKAGFSNFITKVSLLIPDENAEEIWKSVYSLALQSPICFPALTNLLRKCQNQEIFVVINSLPLILASENALPFCVQLFEKVSPEIANNLIKFIVNSSFNSKDEKLEIAKMGVLKFGEYDLDCIGDICDLIKEDGDFLVPNGINFVASLLVNKETTRFGLNLLHRGIADAVVVSLARNLRSLPRILHFFHLSLVKIKEEDVKDTDIFENTLTAVVFLCLRLSANQKERTAVVSPANLILKKINPQILKNKWENEKWKSDILAALNPPVAKKAPAIELKTFGVLRQTTSRWQSLEIDDS